MNDQKPIPEKGKNKKSIIVLSVILAVVVVASSVFGAVFLSRKSNVPPKDGATVDVQNIVEASSPHGYISQNVNWFDESQAMAVNSSIQKITGDSNGLFVTLKSGTAVDNLVSGDVFYLEGNENTPIGEPYFGKIKSIEIVNGTTLLSLENPAIDEVFDSIFFQSGNVFAEGADITVETIEGVSVASGATPLNTSNSFEDLCATPLAYKSDGEKPEISEVKSEKWSYSPSEDLKFEISVDLLDAFGITDETTTNKSKGTNTTKVYVLPYGEVYHLKDCRYLKAKNTEKEINLIDAVDLGYRSCSICKPAVLPNNDDSSESELKVTGSMGIRNIYCDILFEYNNKSPQNCSVNVSGTAFGEVNLKGGSEMDVAGITTENEILKSVKLQGLREKRFPLAYFSIVTKVSCVSATTESVRREVSSLPVSILLIAYFDINGNITFEVNGDFSYERDFNFNQAIIKNGQANFKNDLQISDPEVDFDFHLGGEGEVDAHFGVSLLVYVMNVNVVDVGIIKVGAESEGELALTVSKETLNSDKPICDSSIYIRGYLKLIDISIRLKYQVDIGEIINYDDEITKSWTLIDVPIFTFNDANNSDKSEESGSTEQPGQSGATEQPIQPEQSGDTQSKLSDTCQFVLCEVKEGEDCYQLVANQYDGYPETTFEFGVIKNNKWLVPMSANNALLNQGKWVGSQYNTLDVVNFRHIGGPLFIYRNQTLYNVETGVTFNSVRVYDNYKSSNAELVAISIEDIANPYVKYYNTNTKQTKRIDGYFSNVQVPDNIDEISEGVFYASGKTFERENYQYVKYAGFFDCNGNMVIDLTEHIIYQDQEQDLKFKNGTCTIRCVNNSGVFFDVTIDKAGKVIKQEKVEW